MKRALAALGGAAVGAGITWLARNIHAGITRGSFGAPDAVKRGLETHVRQIRRYAFASSQDISPVVGITHASYSLILLDTLEEIAGKEAIKRAGYDPAKLRKFITELQDKHAERLQPCDAHLQKILALEQKEGKPYLPGFVVAGVGAAPRGA